VASEVDDDELDFSPAKPVPLFPVPSAGRASVDREALIAMLLLITAMPEYQLC
jgi:hypothetical protein